MDNKSPIVSLWSTSQLLKLCNHSAKIPRYFTYFLILGLCSCTCGCHANKFTLSANATPIREIKPNSKRQVTVYVQGKVEKYAPLIKKWVYQINDSTGKIWVVTNQNNLKEGQQVVFKAKVLYQSIPLAGKEFGEVYLEEE